MRTIQTQKNQFLGGYGVQSSPWQPVGNYKRISLTQVKDKAQLSNTHVHWSNTGDALHGMDTSVTTGTGQWQAGITDVKAKYFRIQATNGHATETLTTDIWVNLLP